MAVNLKDLIDLDLLAYFKSKLDLLFAGKVDKENGKGLSSNDYTSDEKTKLAGVATGAQVNTLEGVQVAGTTINPVNKIANIPAATTSAPGAMSAADKTKLDGIATGAQVNVIESVKVNGTALTPSSKAVDVAVPVPATAAPLMDGTAAVGSSAKFAKEDHVHPSDSTKVDKEAGKGLSTNDFTDSYKDRLDTLGDSYVDVGTWAETIPAKVFDLTISGSNLVLNSNIGLENLMTAITNGVNIWFLTKDLETQNSTRWHYIDMWTKNTIHMTLACLQQDGTIAWATLTPTSASTMSGVIHTSSSTSNDFTDALKTKLEGIEAGAQVNVVTNASSTGSGAAQTMTVSKGSTNYTTYTKDALDTSFGLKANASSVYTKTEIDQKLVGAMNYKGTKAAKTDLPASGNTQGDVWHITADGSEWAWNGTAWEELGTALDLSGYVEDDDLGLATTEDIDTLFT